MRELKLFLDSDFFGFVAEEKTIGYQQFVKGLRHQGQPETRLRGARLFWPPPIFPSISSTAGPGPRLQQTRAFVSRKCHDDPH